MKGICFIPPLLIKVTREEKTQTRRIIPNVTSARASVFVKSGFEDNHGKEIKPRYNPGDILFLKEPYYEAPNGFIAYKYGYPHNIPSHIDNIPPENEIKWLNKLFMPASAARHFIRITTVRMERLQDITSSDCFKEGIFKHVSHAVVYYQNGLDGLMYRSPITAYIALINQINGKQTWETNPLVWVYDFILENNNNPRTTTSPLRQERHEEITVCPVCSGTGCTQTYNDRERCYDPITCHFCNGEKVVKKTTTIRYEKTHPPPGINKNYLYLHLRCMKVCRERYLLTVFPDCKRSPNQKKLKGQKKTAHTINVLARHVAR